MAAKRNGLGKGLDSLIPNKAGGKATAASAKDSGGVKAEKETGNGEVLVKINEVEPNREQPRKDFDEDSLMELADSIKQFGILQPLLVHKKKDYYEIIAGERRWRAAKLAGVKEVPVIIKEYTEQEIVEISLIENIQRENLNPIEEAMAYKRLLEEFDLKQDEVAERVSKSRTAVTNSMRLLKLSDRVQQMIVDDMISTGHARALLALDDEEQQYLIANKIFDEKLSVRETEKLVKSLKNPKKEVKKEKQEHTFVYQNLEEQMKNIMGTKVSVNPKANGKGKIEIEYYSERNWKESMTSSCLSTWNDEKGMTKQERGSHKIKRSCMKDERNTGISRHRPVLPVRGTVSNTVRTAHTAYRTEQPLPKAPEKLFGVHAGQERKES